MNVPAGRAGDVDCAVDGHDRTWPLRLGRGWTLCQSLHHGIGSRYWVLERAGCFYAFDVLDDPRGAGRDAFPSNVALDGPSLFARPALRGAYLASKRIRKRVLSSTAWEQIGTLARSDSERFRDLLERVFGRRIGSEVAALASEGRPPTDELHCRARRAQILRRVRTPGAAAMVLASSARRLLERVARPTGMIVVVAGPDGSGKSTLAAMLRQQLAPPFRRSHSVHWRPGILPRPGRLLGRAQADASRPHARPPHGKVLSLALLLYYWLDFLLGSLLLLQQLRVRSGLVVVERGWWDVAVDPARYRLDVPGSIVRLLGRLLPEADLLLVLDAPAKAVRTRKSELTAEELERQLRAWRSLPVPRSLRLDASQPREVVAARARDVVLDRLERRETARLGAGWAALPSGSSARWVLPRGSRRVARRALEIYHPVTTRSRAGWELARLLAATGAFRLLPRGEAPPRAVLDAIGAALPPRSTVAVARCNAPGRYVAAAVHETRGCTLLAKVASDEAGKAALKREAAMLAKLGPLLAHPLACPLLLDRQEGVLLFEFAPWRPRLRPWRLPEEVAAALGAFFAATGAAQGDFAPWNLLRGYGGWTIVDWEQAREDAPPFFDLHHYLVQAHTMLGRPSVLALLSGAEGRGSIGAAVRAYAEAAGVDPAAAPAALREYSALTAPLVDTSTALGSSSFRVRKAILSTLPQ